MITISAGKFFTAWTPVALAAAAVDPAPRLADLFEISIAGITVPPVTCALGAIGVIAARPLARKGEQELSLWLFLLVSVVMMIVVELWVIEHRPSALFAFVIAIGLGFSGYSLIELVGQELRSIVSSKARAIADRLGARNDEGSHNG
jgi:drug/metabolite transporter (DMT)-like permease